MFFMASRLDREKGIDTALQALGLLSARRPDLSWKLEVAGNPGDPAYRTELDHLIALGGITNRVSFVGKLSRDQVLAKMREATAFVSCSRYGEPFAGTIIETLASGTPLIGSIDGSIKEVVVDGESALLFAKDDAQKLSEHMEAVLTDGALRTKLALNGLNVIEERYTLDKILDQTEATFIDVLARNNSKVACAK